MRTREEIEIESEDLIEDPHLSSFGKDERQQHALQLEVMLDIRDLLIERRDLIIKEKEEIIKDKQENSKRNLEFLRNHRL